MKTWLLAGFVSAESNSPESLLTCVDPPAVPLAVTRSPRDVTGPAFAFSTEANSRPPKALGIAFKIETHCGQKREPLIHSVKIARSHCCQWLLHILRTKNHRPLTGKPLKVI